jgi:PKD repeat protein
MRHLAIAWGVATLTSAMLLVLASSAAAVVSGSFGEQRRAEPAVNEEPLQYHNGPVLHSSDSYAIYWDPTGTYRGDWKRLINEYLQSVGKDSGTLGNVFAVNGQYRDSGGQAANASTFRGGYTDKDAYPTSGNCSETTAEAPVCLTDQQVRAELQHLIGVGALPGATGPPVYYVLTPPGVIVCTDGGGTGNCSNSTTTPPAAPNGICGYHSAIEPGGANPVVYAVQPWVAGDAGLILNSEPLETATSTPDVLACQNDVSLQEPNQLGGLNPFGGYEEGLADVIVNDLSIEQSNVVVDPLLNGWYQTKTHAEQGDVCRRTFGPAPKPPPLPTEEQAPAQAGLLSNETIGGHRYYLQWAFDSVGVTAGKGITCWSGVALEPHYTSPNPVNAGDVVAFDATESDITFDAHTEGLPADEPYVAPTYSWNFGDGTSVSGSTSASVFHSYTYGGTYEVELTVTDSSSNTNSFSNEITVVGPPPPAPPAPPPPTPGTTPSPSSTSSTSSSANTNTNTGTGTGTATGAPQPKVVATQSVTSHSLASVLRSGLVVSYSISSQVAGRFEVLLASSVAKKIGLKGPLATGLAAGTPPQIVIAKAILVTTQGGHSSYRIKFSKTTAAKLRKLRKVSLIVRMVVHNPSSTVPTTVLSTVNLSH